MKVYEFFLTKIVFFPYPERQLNIRNNWELNLKTSINSCCSNEVNHHLTLLSGQFECHHRARHLCLGRVWLWSQRLSPLSTLRRHFCWTFFVSLNCVSLFFSFFFQYRKVTVVVYIDSNILTFTQKARTSNTLHNGNVPCEWIRSILANSNSNIFVEF